MHPVDFADLRTRLLDHGWPTGLEVCEIPGPRRIAPNSVAVEGTAVVNRRDLGTGRLILLHNPAGSSAWQGTVRLVAMTRAEVDPSMTADPLVGQVAWSWLTESLASRFATWRAAAGTITSVVSRRFGELDGEPDSNQVEVRASWTPVLATAADLDPHLDAWSDLTLLTSGISPVPDDITSLSARRAASELA